MKTKLDMAHEYAMKHAGNSNSTLTTVNLQVEYAWSYADAMQAEADKREIKGVPEALQQEFINGVEQPRYAPSVSDWQPDWSKAPEGATEWRMLYAGVFKWIIPIPFGEAVVDAPSFNYTGNWQDSLRKRP